MDAKRILTKEQRTQAMPTSFERMTEEQWVKERTRLQAAVTRAKTAVGKAPSLAEKIEAKRKVSQVEEALRQHKLNFHELTAALTKAGAAA